MSTRPRGNLRRAGSSSPIPTSSSGEPSSTHPLLASTPSPPRQGDAAPYTVSYKTRQPRAALSPSSSSASLHPPPPSSSSDGAPSSHLRTSSASSSTSSTSTIASSLHPPFQTAPTNAFSAAPAHPTTSVSKPVVPASIAPASGGAGSPTATTTGPRTGTSFSLLGSSSSLGSAGLSFPSTGFLRPAPSSSSGTSGVGGATEALLFQNLRGDAQSLGLDGDSIGWAIVAALAGAGGAPAAPEWSALRKVLADEDGRDGDGTPMVVLLPKGKLGDGQAVTPAMVMDHILVSDGDLVPRTNRRPVSVSSGTSGSILSARGAVMEERRVVTLSGFRGLVEGERMVLSSYGKGLDLHSRPSASPSSILPPVSPSTHLGDQLTAPSTLRYPLFHLPLSSCSTTLTVPLLAVPPSPPSPTAAARGGASTTARLASLFANHRGSVSSDGASGRSTPTASTDPLPPAAEPSPPATPTSSHPAPSSKPALALAACAIDASLSPSSDLAASLRAVLASRIRAALRDGAGLPDAAVEEAVAFAARFLPSSGGEESDEGGGVGAGAGAKAEQVVESIESVVTGGGGKLFGRRKRHSTVSVASVAAVAEDPGEGRDGAGAEEGKARTASMVAATPGDMSEAVQRLYEDVRQITAEALSKRRRSADPASPSGADEGVGGGGGGEEEGAERVAEEAEEEAVDQALENVEAVLSDELYDRWFCPVGSGDEAADEAMAGRIAGLNLLDLTLDHLGLDLERNEVHDPQGVDKIRAGIEDLVEATTAELIRLQDAECRSPKEKLGVFVGLHKLIVDTLGQLPRIPMKDDRRDAGPDGEVELATRTPRPEDPPADERRSSSSASSADVILPLLIYAVVRANPPRLLSHLSFIKRFRGHSLVLGEAAYCLVNIDAVCEFVRSVDPETFFGGQAGILAPPLAGAGSGSQKAEDGASAPIVRSRRGTLTQKGAAGRDKLAAEVDNAFAAASRVVAGVFGETGRMLSGALDSSAKLMGSNNNGTNTFTPEAAAAAAAKNKPRTLEDVRQVLSGQARDGFAKARVGLLRRATSVGSGMGGSSEQSKRHRSRSSEGDWAIAKEMTEVASADGAAGEPAGEEKEGGGQGRLRAFFNRDPPGPGDSGKMAGEAGTAADRPSLGDRLSSIPGLARLNTDRDTRPREIAAAKILGRPRRSTLDDIVESPVSYPPSRGPPPPLPPRISSNAGQGSLDPPISRFLDCHTEDLKISDVPVLLDEYRRLVSAVRDARMFAEGSR